MSEFQAMGNVVLATMEASVQLGYEEQNDLLATSNIAITLSSGLSSLMNTEQDTLNEIMNGTYGAGIFDGNDAILLYKNNAIIDFKLGFQR